MDKARIHVLVEGDIEETYEFDTEQEAETFCEGFNTGNSFSRGALAVVTPEPTPEREHMVADEFVKACRLIAHELGEQSQNAGLQLQVTGVGSGGEGLRYEDDMMVILADAVHPGQAMQVTRKAFGKFTGTNPTTSVTGDGRCIRHHGEHCYIVPRIKRLIAELASQEVDKT